MSGAPRKRDYAAEYARRKNRLANIGLTPYSARKRGSSTFGPVSQKQAMLAKFGVSEREFEGMRIANLEYAGESRFTNWRTKDKTKKRRLALAVAVNTYQPHKDRPGDWSEERVGYVVSFYRAIVDPRSNYSSLLDKRGNRILRKGFPKTNKWQAALLVKYSGLMQLNEFEVRYGAIPE